MRLGVQAAYVDGGFVPGDVDVAGAQIGAVGIHPPGSAGLALPGFVDLQVNGFAGVDFAAAEPSDVARAGAALAATGVTAYQPTLITAAEAGYLVALPRIAAAQAQGTGPRLLGVHLEGPFLSPARHGAHDPALMVDPDPALMERLLAAGPVTHVSLAPERPGALELIGLLTARGVTVALGHSDADAAAAHAGFLRGATAVTHLFNGMRAFGHRDPGLAGAALARPGVVVTLIVDGVHLAADTVRLVAAAARGRVALVTDAIAAAGMPAGDYPLGNRTVRVAGGRATLADGTLAGSVLTMDRAVRNLADLGVATEEAIGAATAVPAAAAGRPDLGTLRPGTPADVIVVNDDLAVRRTLVAGQEVWARD